MRSLVRYITRKSRGGIAAREDTAEGDILIVGRGNDCAIHLPDPRILLRHVELAMRGTNLYVTALPGADFRINGNLTHSGRLTSTDVLQVGPYEIRLVPPSSKSGPESEAEDNHDLILTVELVQPLGDDLNRLVERSQIHITGIGLPLRTWCWVLALAVAVLTFAIPFGLNLFHAPVDTKSLTQFHAQPPAAPTGVWTAGTISASHKFFGKACETCHQIPFVSVRDGACLNCHDGIQQHVMQSKFPSTPLNTMACVDCHKEHRGEQSITLNDQTFCVSCHGNLTEKVGHTDMRNVTDFGTNHPQFKPTVMADPDAHIMRRDRVIGATPAPTEENGFIFPHIKHLQAEGVRDPVRGVVHLICQDCHVATTDGATMKTPTFKDNCHSCHQLKFDPRMPERELIHGNPQEVFKQVRDVYDAIAMRGGYDEPTAPAIVRRLPGVPLTDPERRIASDWAAAKSSEIINGQLGKGLCGQCHLFTAPGDAKGQAHSGAANVLPWNVKTVAIADRYLPKSEFTHAKHSDVACVTCHASTTSKASSDVLIPGIAVCQSCHGGEKAVDRVPSTCITCHRFHRQDMDPMHPTKAKNVETERWDNHEEAVHHDVEDPVQ